jgi:hypothetical protein
MYAASYRVPDWLRELSDFYEQISNLLIYRYLHYRWSWSKTFKNLWRKYSTLCRGDKSEDIDSLLNSLYYIRHQIFETSSFEKYSFNMCLYWILNLSQSSREWGAISLWFISQNIHQCSRFYILNLGITKIL